ncbi:DUF151 domain-containing protein [Kocuria rhizophila]|nr:DUF151 domain-containing protein [Kocuria rhizophila]
MDDNGAFLPHPGSSGATRERGRPHGDRGVRMDVPTGQPRGGAAELDGPRRLPIWPAPTEATSIVFALQGSIPVTDHRQGSGRSITRVAGAPWRDTVFYAAISFDDATAVDARASDASPSRRAPVPIRRSAAPGRLALSWTASCGAGGGVARGSGGPGEGVPRLPGPCGPDHFQSDRPVHTGAPPRHDPHRPDVFPVPAGGLPSGAWWAVPARPTHEEDA